MTHALPPLVVLPHTRAPAATREDIGPHEVWAVDVASSPSAYWSVLRALWNSPRDTVIVEHDIIPTPGAITDLLACPAGWCTQPYPYLRGDLHRGLGCTKFAAGLMRATPALWDQVAAMSDATHPPRHWCRLDAWSHHCLTAAGHTRCDHTIPVDHPPVDHPAHGCI